MKLFASLTALFVAAAVVPPVLAQDPFTYETSERLWSTGDFNNDGLVDAVIVNRAAGTFIMGYMNGSGAYTWGASHPLGIVNVTSLSVGKVQSNDVVAATSPSAGRVVGALKRGATDAVTPYTWFPAVPESRGLGFFNIDATGDAELLVVGNKGDGTPNRFTYQALQNLAASATQLWNAAYNQETAKIFPVRVKSGQPLRVAEYYGGGFFIEGVGPSGLTSTPGSLSGAIVSLNTTQFAVTSLDGGALSHFLFYENGGTTLRTARITEPTAGSYGWTALTSSTLPKAVKCMVALPKTGGGSRLAMIFTDGTGGIYNFTGSGNPTLYASFTSGAAIEAILPGSTDNALVYRANGTWERWAMGSIAPSGPAASGAAPLLTSPGSNTSNVLLLTAEPWAKVGASVVSAGHVAEWTTTAVNGGTTWNVTSLTYGGSSGLGSSQTGSVPQLAGATAAMVNQVRSDVSISFTSSEQGAYVGDVALTPPAGIYPPAERAPGVGAPAFWITGALGHPASLLYDPDPATAGPLVPISPALVVSLAPTQANTTLFFRVNAGAWTSLNSPGQLDLYASSTVEAYAMSGPVRSPIRSATYTFTAPSILSQPAFADTDTDGLPDDWEKAFGLTSPTADADGDGASNLAEYQAKTDPRDSISKPSSLPTLAVKSPAVPNQFTLTWDASDATVQLQSSQDFISWQNVTTGIVTNGANKEYTISLIGLPNNSRKFYRLIKP